MWLHQRSQGLRVIWAPSFVRRVIRHRVTRCAVIAVVGLWCAASLTARAHALDDERANWGSTEPVAVVVGAIEMGSLVMPDVELRHVPTALIPADAVTSIDAQSRAKVELFPGEIVLRSRLTGTQPNGPPAGMVALTVPVVAQVPLISVGDLVDLWMVDSANFSSNRVAHRVVVLAVGPSDVTVAVPDDQVASATVASLRPVTVTLIG